MKTNKVENLHKTRSFRYDFGFIFALIGCGEIADVYTINFASVKSKDQLCSKFVESYIVNSIILNRILFHIFQFY